MTPTKERFGFVKLLDLPAENAALRAENAKLKAALENIVGQYQSPQKCGHNFTCVCLNRFIAEARAALAASQEG